MVTGPTHSTRNGLLGLHGAGGAIALLAATVRFVGFDYCVWAGTVRIRRVGLHGFADAMAHEPRGLVGNSDHAADLMGAHALLGRDEQLINEQPLLLGNFRTLKDGADIRGVLLAAVIALDQGVAVLLALKARGIEGTAMRAERTIGTLQRFQMLAGCGLVSEVGRKDVSMPKLWRSPCFIAHFSLNSH
jgi:hypothetical protein